MENAIIVDQEGNRVEGIKASDSKELIFFKQPAIISYDKMEFRGLEVKREIQSLGISEIKAVQKNRKLLKENLALLRNELKILEGKRKLVKSKTMLPYDKFNDSYELNIKSVYTNAIEELHAKKISVEAEMVIEKTKGIQAYFDGVNAHDFITLDKTGVNIILSATDARLRKHIDAFLKVVNSEVESILTMDNSIRILGYYERTLNLSESIYSVNNDIKKEADLKLATEKAEKLLAQKRIDEELAAHEKSERDAKDLAEKAEKAAIKSDQNLERVIENALDDDAGRDDVLKAKHSALEAKRASRIADENKARLDALNKEKKEKEEAEKKVHKARFAVEGTMGQLKLLAEFMRENEIQFKTIARS